MGMRSDSTLKDLLVLIDGLGIEYKDLKMIELGNQWLQAQKGQRMSGKVFFTQLGVKHISIDTNGLDGALPLDLCSDIDMEGHGIEPADIVTNFGTSEHVVGQEACFRNVHNFCRVGGLMVHFVPPEGTWARHGLYRYTVDFFDRLATQYKYKTVVNRLYEKAPYVGNRGLIFCALEKACP